MPLSYESQVLRGRQSGQPGPLGEYLYVLKEDVDSLYTIHKPSQLGLQKVLPILSYDIHFFLKSSKAPLSETDQQVLYIYILLKYTISLILN